MLSTLDSLNVFLVEDSPEDVLFFKRTLKHLREKHPEINFEFQHSNCLKDALVKVANTSFDIIFLDLSLPDSQKFLGLEKLKEQLEDHFPIVVLTGDENDSLALEALNRGAQDYLKKSEMNAYNLSRSLMYSLERSKAAKELEELRVHQAKTLKMATLGEMSGSIAHEINNPLAIILGYTDILLADIEEGVDSDRLKNSVEKIEETTVRISKIIKSLKSYSRRSEQDPMSQIAFPEILEDTLNLCIERFKTSKIELKIQHIEPAHLLCRDMQISQVLLNLLNNAHDAVKKNDKAWVSIDSSIVDDKLKVLIQDSGSIKDESVRRKLFSPFFTTKPKGEGTGLGMSISKSIIENHGGSLMLLDNSKNTCFEISIPIVAVSNEKSA